MASNDKTDPADEALEGSWSPKRPRTATKKNDEARTEVGPVEAGALDPGRGVTTSDSADAGKTTSPDPEQLADEIDRTREELAETLDAIADKVSPKKAAARTKKKVGDAVKDGANDAVEAVKDGVSAVKEKVTGDGDADRSPLTPATSVEVGSAAPASAPGTLADAAYTPVGAGAPSYATLPPAPPSRMPALAGAGAAVLVLLLVMKRRRR